VDLIRPGVGIRTAVISASRNAREVLAEAGVDTLFEARIDGIVAAELGLAGKPAPDVFLEAARRLVARPERRRSSRTRWPAPRPAAPAGSAG
jgi:beta-phosphoglucomutase-like phosphatase (HAD superfamily)